MKFQIDCHLVYQVAESASFLFNVAAVRNSLQRVISEDLSITGAQPAEELAASGQRLHRIAAGTGRVELTYHAVISVESEMLDASKLDVAPLHKLPREALVFLYPSRFCQSDLLARFANREFTNIESGFDRLTRICNWIYEYVEYLQGSTNSSTSAFDTATQRAGVCRDFAHLGIAVCRALGIPARFVSGYAYGLNPPDFHAYFEAFLGGRWIIADPTRLSPQSSFIRIGEGRDAADTSFAMIFGNAPLTEMQLSMQLAAAESQLPQYVDGPISNCPL
ncbi:MAG TPA: transglutaminase family protein [Chthoniobacterales bacterium]|nr:transglutaminase family protein [Chthoniobacterales bacterium]